ncbi:MAG: HAD hydrolase-like protein [Bacillota bacterium]|nr:HAD hydrolase-like protein [Bacillota bacterium]
MKSLIFFDINGTIIERDKSTDLPYIEAANELLFTTNSMLHIDNSARSDMDVFREILKNHDINYTDGLWNEFLVIYEKKLIKYSKTNIWRVNKDAKSFIEKLSKTNHKISMITGELEIGSKYKLEKINVWKYFPVGGFGEDNISRLGIAEVALKKAISHYKNDFDEIYVIGDTLLDIKTARHIGAKIISITTGSNTKKELKTLNPDYIINKFKEIEHLFL